MNLTLSSQEGTVHLPLSSESVSWTQIVSSRGPPALLGVSVLTKTNKLLYFELDSTIVKRKRGKEVKNVLKWSHSFSPSSSTLVQILFAGADALNPNLRSSSIPVTSDHLIVTKEERGLVFYRVNGEGLEELQVDFRFGDHNDTNVDFKGAMGNIFCDRQSGPGLLSIHGHQSGVGPGPKIYMVSLDTLNEHEGSDESDEFALWEGHDTEMAPEFVGAQKIWITSRPSPDHSKSFIVVQKEDKINVFQLNCSNQFESMGHLQLPAMTTTLPSKHEVRMVHFFVTMDKEKRALNLLVVLGQNLSIIYRHDDLNKRFYATSHLYATDPLTVTVMNGQNETSDSTQLFVWPSKEESVLKYSNETLQFQALPIKSPQKLITPLAAATMTMTRKLEGQNSTNKIMMVYEQYGKVLVGPVTFLENHMSPNVNGTSSSVTPEDGENFETEKPQFVDTDVDHAEGSLVNKRILVDLKVQTLAEALQVQTGQLNFVLPVLPLIGFNLMYESQSTNSQVSYQELGDDGHLDWQVSKNPYIILNPGNTDASALSYEGDYKYYLMVDNRPHRLKKNGQQLDNLVQEFETSLDKSEFSKIEFNKQQNYWIFTSKTAILTFGQEPKPSTDGQELSSSTSSSANLLINGVKFLKEKLNFASIHNGQLAIEWHLVRKVNLATGQIFLFKYVQGHSSRKQDFQNQVEKIYLKSVHVKTQESQVSLTKIEFTLGDAVPYKLMGYDLYTQSYRQLVRFEYEEDNYLKCISQKIGREWRPILKFSYVTRDAVLMNQVEFSELKTKIFYEFNQPKQIPVKPFAQIDYSSSNNKIKLATVHGFGFSAIVHQNLITFYKHTDGSKLTLSFDDSSHNTKEVALAMNRESNCVFLTQHMATNLKIRAYCCSLEDVISVKNKGVKFEWKLVQTKNLNINSTTPTSNFKILEDKTGSFFTLQNQNQLTLYNWRENEAENGSLNNTNLRMWQMSQAPSGGIKQSLQLQNNILVWYEESNNTTKVYWLLKEGGEWKWENLKFISITQNEAGENCSSFFIRRLDLGSKIEENIRTYFDPIRLLVRDNLLLLTGCDLQSDGWTVESKLNLLILGKNGHLATPQSVFRLSQQNLKNEHHNHALEDGEKIVFKYEKSGQKFIAKAHGRTGEHTRVYTESFRKDQKDRDTKFNLIQWENYRTHIIDRDTIWVGKDKKVFFQNSLHNNISGQWKQSNLSTTDRQKMDHNSEKFSFPLPGSDLILKKFGKDDQISIFGPSQTVSLGTKNATNISNFWPHYLAAGMENSKIKIVQFSSFPPPTKIDKHYTIDGEKFPVGLSSPQVLVTEKSDRVKSILLRTMTFNPKAVLSKIQILTPPLLLRETEYEFLDPSFLASGSLIFNQRRVFPGANSLKYGWIEYSTSESENAKVFDGHGKFLKLVKKFDEGRPKNENESEYSLMDKSGNFLISNISPFKASDCQVGYIGFENYEKTKGHESCPDWTFDESKIIKNGFSFTGKNFLRLNSTNGVSPGTEFNIENKQSYTISAWIRSPALNLYDTVSSILKAQLVGYEELTWLSKILMEQGSWFLLQINILYNEVTAYKKFLREVTNSTVIPQNSTDRIKMVVSPNLGVVDIDHILFAPVGWNSEFYVMNPATFETTEKILGRTDLVTRIKYDQEGHPFVVINSRNQVVRLEVRNDSTVNEQGLTCAATFETLGDAGWFENFESPLRQSVTLEDENKWKVLPGKIRHFGSTPDPLHFNFNFSSFLLRFSFDLQKLGSEIKIMVKNKMVASLSFTSDFDPELKFDVEISSRSSSCQQTPAPQRGAVTLLIFDGARLFFWLNKKLVCDTLVDFLNTDTQEVSPSSLLVQGHVTVGDLVIMPRPKVTMTYGTPLGDIIQEIAVLSRNSVMIAQTIYDELGRSKAMTKPTVLEFLKNSNAKLLQYRENFARRLTKFNQTQIEGEVDLVHKEDLGFPFTLVEFRNHTFLEETQAEGMPGKDWSVGGKFEILHPQSPHTFIKTLFPPGDAENEKNGFRYKVSKTRDGYEQSTVYSKNGDENDQNDAQIVASAAVTPTGKNLLATYDYDDVGNLIAAYSPQFHFLYRTVLKGQAWTSLRQDPEFSMQKNVLASFYKYDRHNRLIHQSHPDSGISDYFYGGRDDHLQKVLFSVHRTREEPQIVDCILYFEYGGPDGNLSETGILTHFNETESPQNLIDQHDKWTKVIRTKFEPKIESEIDDLFLKQDMIVSSFHAQIGSNLTNFADHIETAEYDKATENLVGRSIILPTKPGLPALLLPTQFGYNAVGDKLTRIYPPFENMEIIYEYNGLGQVSQIVLINHYPNDSSFKFDRLELANFEYSSNGRVSRERLHGVLEKNVVDTEIFYNSPGFPVRRQNQFVDETMDYVTNGYGDTSTGTPTSVMSTTFSRRWASPWGRFEENGADFLKQGIPPELAVLCWNKLVQNGYVGKDGRILKMLHPHGNKALPIRCREGDEGEKILKVFSEKIVQSAQDHEFGFKFQYGPHKDLMKAKFFVLPRKKSGENLENEPSFCTQPLTLSSLQEALGTGFGGSGSQFVLKLWTELIKSGFLVQDKSNEISAQVHGKRARSMIDPKFVRQLNDHFINDGASYMTDLIRNLATNVTVSTETIGGLLKIWEPMRNHTILENEAVSLVTHLTTNGYLVDASDASKIIAGDKIFAKNFAKIFSDLLSNHSGQIFEILHSFFDCSINSSPFDLQVLDVDYNGNFKLMIQGSTRIELNYVENTNRLSQLKISDWDTTKVYQIGHDQFGNLDEAPHKNVEKIFYDELTAKPLLMKLGDGRSLKFLYDFKGERVSKEVWSVDGQLLKKVKYLSRDHLGRSLVEEEWFFISPEVPPMIRTTSFVYGPQERGLVAFLRNGKLYHVYTDNINSIRLVLFEGQPVATFDYFPYGQLMIHHIDHFDADIRYRFAGQELDEETNLYNFHARIYDPFLGRFYQIDPEEQFFSPYKYAGNSPLNAIDPDGKFIFTLIACITLAVVGAYVGGSSANNNWNPVKWNWKSPGTWVGIVTGGLTGALIPITGGASIAALAPVVGGTAAATVAVGALGVGGAYLMTSAANQNWNPSKWDWSSPGTYNGLFSGFAMGIALPAGVSNYHSVYSQLSTNWKIAFVGGTVTLGIGAGYVSAAAANGNDFNPANWDWKNPATFVNFMTTGVTITLGGASVVDSGKYLTKQFKIFSPGFSNMSKTMFKSAKEMLKFAKDNAAAGKAFGKTVGIFTAVGISSYMSVAAATDDWLVRDWSQAGTSLAFFDGFWGGWIGQNSAKRRGESIKIYRDKAKVGKFRKFEALFKKAATDSYENLKRMFAPDADTINNPLNPVSGPDVASPPRVAAVIGNDKWAVVGFSGMDKGSMGGIFYLDFDSDFHVSIRLNDNQHFPGLLPEHQPILGVPGVDQQINNFIKGQKSGIMTSFDDGGDLNQRIKTRIDQTISQFYDSLPGTSTLSRDLDVDLLHRTFVSEIELKTEKMLTGAQTVKIDGKMVHFKDAPESAWVTEIQKSMRREPDIQKMMAKKLLDKLATDYELPPSSLGESMNAAKNGILALQKENQALIENNPNLYRRNNEKYLAVQTELNDIIKPKMKHVLELRNQIITDAGPDIVHIVRDYIVTEKEYKFIPQCWAPSNCAEAHAMSAITLAKDYFGDKLDLKQLNHLKLDNVEYLTSYSIPKDFSNIDRCPQCQMTTVQKPMGELKFVMTEQQWVKPIEGLEQKILIYKAKKSKGAGEIYPFFDWGKNNQTLHQNSRHVTPVPALRNLNPLLVDSIPFSSGASSGASSVGQQGIIFQVEKILNNFYHILMGPKILKISDNFHKDTPADLERHLLVANKKNKKKIEGGWTVSSENCIPFVKLGAEYATNGFTCFIPTGSIGIINSFGSDQPSDESTVMTRQPRKCLNFGFGGQCSDYTPPHQNVKHTFDKEGCKFLGFWFDQKAAFCEGTRSNLIFTPFENEVGFDRVNDLLLLLLLFQHWVTPAVSTENESESEWTDDDDFSQMNEKIQEKSWSGWSKRLSEMKARIERIGQADDTPFSKFALFIIQDFEEEIEAHKKCGVMTEAQTVQFCDRISALDEEIEETEQILWSQVTEKTKN